ncbi:MAG: nicotinate-nucleotide adenylyltransferase [Planctomycetota bacterium]|jgi:nicotinate-nucleotide adenylyltransferase
MRIGYFGGSFDPVHKGHLTLVKEVRELAQLDEVFLVPTCRAPHKIHRRATSGLHRVKMLEIAIEDEPNLSIDTREINRDGPTYTVDTMREIRAERPQDDLFFLIGMDSLADLPTWYCIEELSALVTFLVALRPGHKTEDADAILAGSIIKYEILPTTAVDVSSTGLRREIAQGANTADLVMPQVGEYIRGAKLYQTTY